MIDPVKEQVLLPKDGRSYVWRCVLASVLLTAVFLAICGATGLARSEYRLPPWQEAILLPLGGSCYGVVPGLIIGLILDWRVRRRMRNRDAV